MEKQESYSAHPIMYVLVALSERAQRRVAGRVAASTELKRMKK